MFGISETPTSGAEKVKPRHSFDDLVYPDHVKEEITNLLAEEEFADALIEEGLHPKRKILLHGPSGCGKTSIAHAIATHLNIDLLVAPPNALQSMYVGQSEKTIAATIKQASEKKCVLLIDEFDAIAMQRTNGNRYATSVVNTLLTSLENGEMQGFLVACTNHLDHLDDALLRRFDAVFKIPMATQEALKEVAHKVLKGRYKIKVEDVMKDAHTPALVERNAKAALRKAVIEQEKINPRPKRPKQIEHGPNYRQGQSLDHDGHNSFGTLYSPASYNSMVLNLESPQLG